jgi:hypothetical protein
VNRYDQLLVKFHSVCLSNDFGYVFGGGTGERTISHVSSGGSGEQLPAL